MIPNHIRNIRPPSLRWLATVGVVLVLSVASFSVWKHNKSQQEERRLQEASHVYAQLIQSHRQSNSPITEEEADQFFAHYPKTPYPALLALKLAQQSIQANQTQQALAWLNKAARETNDAGIRSIAIQREARILITLGQYDKALKRLDTLAELAHITSIEALRIEELRGDCLVGLNRTPEALAAYKKAEQASTQMGLKNSLLQMKKNNLE